MPVYEYKCGDCGTKFEVLVYSENTQIKCEKCGSENSQKLMSGFAGAVSSRAAGNSCTSKGGFT